MNDGITSFGKRRGYWWIFAGAGARGRDDSAFAATRAIDLGLLLEKRRRVELHGLRAATTNVSDRRSRYHEQQDGRQIEHFDTATNLLLSNLHGNTSRSTMSPAVADTTGYAGYFFSHVLAP